MPELPDVVVYIEAIQRRTLGAVLERIRLSSPFVLRTIEPRPDAFAGKTVTSVRRLGKRIAIGLEGDLFAVIHLMIAGRLHWKPAGTKIPGKVGLLAMDFPSGTMTLTEASTKKRASLHLVRGEANLDELHRGGLEVLDASLDAFRDALLRENHTIKRSLTDPRLFSGIGNAYSDEILHCAKMSPMKLTQKLTDEEVKRLFKAVKATLNLWTERLRRESGEDFPEKVTAFRDEMAVHGKYKQPCPACGAKVQRIVYAENEANYCAGCQTGGKLLADRALSRLMKDDWPRTLDELEQKVAEARR